ncbi:hypothetical protein SLS60_002569 [Paraconiothyrium brasiliense]|uniref:WD40 repeat-like protein n=1 Tax=Paraconiothyrium brasiliense TaxID=300254 RepID=A0ABR3RTB2_9PLEO
MAPTQRGRSLAKDAFPPMFRKLKTSTYTDNMRPGASSSHYIRTLSWNSTGGFIATGSADRTLRIWNPERPNVKNSTELRTPVPAGHKPSPQIVLERVAFHPINENELASCSTDGMVRLWDIRSRSLTAELRVAPAYTRQKDEKDESPFTLAWHPDGSALVAGRKDNRLCVIDRAGMRVSYEHREPLQTNQCVFDWTGEHLYATNGDGYIKILRYPDFSTALSLNAHTASCYAVAYSPSGEYVAAGGGDALVSLWDTQEWICVRTLDLTNSAVKSIDFSFDGSYIAAGAEDREEKKLNIAHVESGETVISLDLMAPALQVAWHPSRYVLAYSADAQGLKIVGGMS